MQHPAGRSQLDDGLASAQRCSEALAAALLAGFPEQVALAAQELHHSAQILTGLVAGLPRNVRPDPVQRRRLREIAQALALQREACLRRGAVVDRALNSIIPSTRASTYQGGSGPYGQQARRSGAFKLISA